jgi:enoyl-CoA hydratase
MGVVTEVVDEGKSLVRAMEYARRFASGNLTAIRYTKRALNEWYRLAMPAYDLAWTGEALSIMGGRGPSPGATGTPGV